MGRFTVNFSAVAAPARNGASFTLRRWTAAAPCPVCGGWDDMPRGVGERCWGYLDSTGRWARCTREQYAGGMRGNTDGTWSHRLDGGEGVQCLCGDHHLVTSVPRAVVAGGSVTWIGREPTVGHRLEVAGRLYTITRLHPYFEIEEPLPRYMVLRLEGVRTGAKAFRPVHPRVVAGRVRWALGRNGAGLVLYRRPDVVAALRERGRKDWIWLCEGERDADNLWELGLVATTNVDGANSWSRVYEDDLRGARVVVAEDNDAAGRERTEKVAIALRDVAAEVRVLRCGELPGCAHDGADISDYLEVRRQAGATDDELRREMAG